jgi:FkbM family methyltransferase
MGHFSDYTQSCVRSARILLRLVYMYGFKSGFLTYVKLSFLGNRADTLVRIDLPMIPAPIFLRSRTSDIETFIQIFAHCEYDFFGFEQAGALFERYAALCSSNQNPLIIDCGANVGLSAIWFSKRFPQAIIYAVEPSEENFTILEKNIASYANVKPILAGIWDCNTRLRIVNPSAEGWAFQVCESNDAVAIKIPATTMPDIMALADSDEILIAKIDIEGAERELFRSNTGWLDRTDLVIIELHDWMLPWQGTSRNFFSCVGGRSFDFQTKGENLFLFQKHHVSTVIFSPLSLEGGGG